MPVQSSWLRRGYFDFSSEDPHNTTSQQIRGELCAALDRPKDSFRIKGYPVGAAWRHTVWFREGDLDHAEAQFFLQVARHYPVLSLGVSVEKGLESASIRANDPERLDRGTWDWQRFVSCCSTVFTDDIPALAANLEQPLTVRYRVARGHSALEDDSRAFSYVDRSWFDRHRGHIGVPDILAHVEVVDKYPDCWVSAYFSLDISDQVAGGMSPSAVADLLVRFDPLRRRLRGQPVSAGERVDTSAPTIEWIEVPTVGDLRLGHGYEIVHRRAGPVAFIEGYPFLKEAWAVIPAHIALAPKKGVPVADWAAVVEETRHAVTTMFTPDREGRVRMRHGLRIGNVQLLINA